MATYNIKSNSSDIVLNNNDTMNVLAGGWADNTTVNAGATMNVSSGGTAWLTELDGGRMIVSGGGSSWETDVNANALFIVSGKPKCVEYTRVNNLGSMIVSSNGQADCTIVRSGGRMVVSTYGSAFSTTVSSGGTMTLMKYAKGSGVAVGGQLTVSSGGSASNTQIYGSGRADVSGGWLFNNTVSSGGMIYVHAGGWTSDTRLSNNGKLIVLENGSAHTNTISSGGKAYVSSGGSATGNTILSGGTMVVSLGGSMGFGNTVSSGGSVVLYGSAGEILTRKGGTVSIKSGAIVTNLTNKGGEIVMEKGALVRTCKGDPIRMPDCDSGWNNYVYDKKRTPAVNTSVTVPAGRKIASDTTAILLDKSVSEKGYSNFVGYGDDTDFVKITLDHAAQVSFNLEGTSAMKFTVWSFTTGTDKKGKTTYSLKSLQATATKLNKETQTYKAATKGLLLEKGDYYISVQSTNAKKGGNSYYNVSLNSGDCEFFDSAKSSNNDDWDDLKTKGEKGKVVSFGQINADTSLVLHDWVGFGDAVDYRKFTIKNDAKLSFALKADDATKFTLYKLISKTDKKGVTTYSLKQLQSTTVKTNQDWTYTKLLKLEAGDYYFSMQSTNAKKGGDADYYVYLEDFETLLSGGKNADALAGPDETGAAALPGAANASAADLAWDDLAAGLESVQDAPLAASDFPALDSVGERNFADPAAGFLAGL